MRFRLYTRNNRLPSNYGRKLKKARPEFDIQCAVVGWLRRELPHVLFTSFSQSLRLHPLQALDLKLAGYLAGTPDLIIFEPRGDCHGLLIEMKAGKNTQSPTQVAFENSAINRGYMYLVLWDFEEAKRAILEYMGKEPNQ